MTNKTKMVAVCGVLTALAMIFSYIESMIPMPVPVPGIKLGVANIAIVTVLYIIGWKEALIIDLVRIILTAMLFGNVNSFIFSMSGGLLSIVGMIILKKCFKGFSFTGVSVVGGVLHNIGQIIAAVFIMDTTAIALYLPVLLISGVITGVIIGMIAGIVTEKVAKNI